MDKQADDQNISSPPRRQWHILCADTVEPVHASKANNPPRLCNANNPRDWQEQRHGCSVVFVRLCLDCRAKCVFFLKKKLFFIFLDYFDILI